MSEPTELIEKYADRLIKVMGDVAPEAWDMLVRGQVVVGLKLAVGSVLFLGAAACFVAGSRALSRKCETAEGAWGASLAGGFFVFVTLLIGADHLMNCIPYLFAPEYMALRELLQ